MTSHTAIKSDVIVKECVKCNNKRKFMCGTPRDETSICGNCWDWETEKN